MVSEEELKNMSPEEIQELQKKQCIFCKIISGEIPSKKVYEDELMVAILDINPANKGHLLIMPKEHYPIMPVVPQETLNHMFVKIKELSKVLSKSIFAEGTNIFIGNGQVAGQVAPHFIIHLIPRESGDNVEAFNQKEIKLDNEFVTKTKKILSSNLSRMLGKNFSEEEIAELFIKTPEIMKFYQDKKTFLKLLETNDELKQIVKNKDVNKIIKIIDEKINSEKESEEKKESEDLEVEKKNKSGNLEKKEKSEKKGEVSLDDIADLLK